tara:strand:- start:80 stop:691 length:612 start_codon:yes stop_codon:yes gene_type:complete
MRKQEVNLTQISLQNGVAVSLSALPKMSKSALPDGLREEVLTRQRDFLRRQIESDPEAQLASQNAQPIHTAFRLNGKLVGTIGVNTGFSSTGIVDGGAYQRAQSMADQQGLEAEKRNDYIANQVSQALKEHYGASLEVITFDENHRPTTGELHAEMFGSAQPVFESPLEDEGTVAWMKVFAQIYSQEFGEDPFEGLDVPYDDQ